MKFSELGLVQTFTMVKRLLSSKSKFIFINFHATQRHNSEDTRYDKKAGFAITLLFHINLLFLWLQLQQVEGDAFTTQANLEESVKDLKDKLEAEEQKSSDLEREVGLQ